MIVHANVVEQSSTEKPLILIATTLGLLRTIYNQPFMQCKVHSGYSEHACSFIYQRLLAPAIKLLLVYSY